MKASFVEALSDFSHHRKDNESIWQKDGEKYSSDLSKEFGNLLSQLNNYQRW